jgi:predicted RNase H-like HicB family nuclease
MMDSDRYLKVVQWSEEDQCYVGTCPGFMLGGVHGDDQVEVYRELCEVVDEWVRSFHEDGEPLPPPTVAPKPCETEAWLLSGRPYDPSYGSFPSETHGALYRLLGQKGAANEVAEPQEPWGGEVDLARRELASLIEEAVVPWTRIPGWMDDEAIRYEVDLRIRRRLRASRYSPVEAERLARGIVDLIANGGASA